MHVRIFSRSANPGPMFIVGLRIQALCLLSVCESRPYIYLLFEIEGPMFIVIVGLRLKAPCLFSVCAPEGARLRIMDVRNGGPHAQPRQLLDVEGQAEELVACMRVPVSRLRE